MKTISTSTKALLAVSTILSLGVLSGCEYCEPLLLATLATVVLKGLYAASEAFYEAMKIHSCTR